MEDERLLSLTRHMSLDILENNKFDWFNLLQQIKEYFTDEKCSIFEITENDLLSCKASDDEAFHAMQTYDISDLPDSALILNGMGQTLGAMNIGKIPLASYIDSDPVLLFHNLLCMRYQFLKIIYNIKTCVLTYKEFQDEFLIKLESAEKKEDITDAVNSMLRINNDIMQYIPLCLVPRQQQELVEETNIFDLIKQALENFSNIRNTPVQRQGTLYHETVFVQKSILNKLIHNILQHIEDASHLNITIQFNQFDVSIRIILENERMEVTKQRIIFTQFNSTVFNTKTINLHSIKNLEFKLNAQVRPILNQQRIEINIPCEYNTL